MLALILFNPDKHFPLGCKPTQFTYQFGKLTCQGNFIHFICMGTGKNIMYAKIQSLWIGKGASCYYFTK